MKHTITAFAVAFGLAVTPALAQSQMGAGSKDEKKAVQQERKADQQERKADQKGTATGSTSTAQPTGSTQPSSTGSTQPSAASTGSTQPSGSGLPSLVTVNLEKVRAEIANNAKIDISKVPVTAQVPVNAAANICGVSVNALGGMQGSGGSPTCTATNSSAAMQFVQNQIK